MRSGGRACEVADIGTVAVPGSDGARAWHEVRRHHLRMLAQDVEHLQRGAPLSSSYCAWMAARALFSWRCHSPYRHGQ